MGWFSNLFGGAPASSSAPTSNKALCVRMPGGYIIDLSPLPADHARIKNAIDEVAAQVGARHEPYQVWVIPNRLLEVYAGNTEALSELTTAVYGATKRVQPRLIVEPEAPAGVVYILGSCGFELCRAGLKLKLVDAKGVQTELDVMEQLEKIRRTPNTRVVTIGS